MARENMTVRACVTVRVCMYRMKPFSTAHMAAICCLLGCASGMTADEQGAAMRAQQLLNALLLLPETHHPHPPTLPHPVQLTVTHCNHAEDPQQRLRPGDRRIGAPCCSRGVGG